MLRTKLTILISLALLMAGVSVAEEPVAQYSSPNHHFQFSYPSSWKRATAKVPAFEMALKPPASPGAVFIVSVQEGTQPDENTIRDMRTAIAAQLKKTLANAAVDTDESIKIAGESAGHLIIHGQTPQKQDVTLDQVFVPHGTLLVSFILRCESASAHPLMQSFDHMLTTLTFTAAPAESAGVAVNAKPTSIPALRDFISKDQGYAVEYPRAWRRINPQHLGGAELSLTPDAEGEIKTRCSVMMVPDDGKGDAPTLDSAQQYVIGSFSKGSTTAGGGSLKLDKATDLQLDRQPARKLVLSGPGPQGGNMTAEVVCSIHGRNLYALMIAGPKDGFSKDEASFDEMVNSFHFADAMGQYVSSQYPFKFQYPSYWSRFTSKDPDDINFTPAAADKDPVVNITVPTTGKVLEVSLEEAERRITADLTKRIPQATVESHGLKIGGSPGRHIQIHSADESADKADVYLCNHNKMIVFFSLQGSSSAVDQVSDQFAGLISSLRFTDEP